MHHSGKKTAVLSVFFDRIFGVVDVKQMLRIWSILHILEELPKRIVSSTSATIYEQIPQVLIQHVIDGIYYSLINLHTLIDRLNRKFKIQPSHMSDGSSCGYMILSSMPSKSGSGPLVDMIALRTLSRWSRRIGQGDLRGSFSCSPALFKL